MTRRWLFPLGAFIVTLVVAAAPAMAKPKVAVLGLEVIDDGSMDARTTLRGKQLTNYLRDQAERPAGSYQIAPGSEKDLLEMKLLSNCSDEAHSCMAQIGKELNADKLIYGKIERQQSGYFLQLKMLDTKSGKLDKTKSRVIPFTDHQTDKLVAHASALYRGLTGEPELGVIVLKVKNADKGTVYLDGEIRTSLAAGSATIRDISAGKHAIAIESDGFQRYTKEVSVSGGKSQEMSIKLRSIGSGGGGDRRGLHKGLAIGGASVAVVSTVGLIVTGLRVNSAESEKRKISDDVMTELGMLGNAPDGNPFNSMDFGTNACKETRRFSDNVAPNGDGQKLLDECDKGENNALYTNIFIGTAIVGAVVAGYFGYKGFLAADEDVLEKDPNAERRKKKPKLRVTIEPLFGPNGAAGSVRVEF